MGWPWGRTCALLLLAGAAWAQSPPPPPARYVTDAAGVLADDVERRLEERLRRFDEETTSQVLVVVYPSLPAGAALEDFTVRAAQAWRAGRKKLHNGAVLFVFVADRRSRLEVGYGLEGPLPDLRARQILDEVMAPRFREGDYAAGLEAGVEAILAAVKDEYRAPPRPARGPPAAAPALSLGSPLCLLLSFVLVVWLLSRSRPRGRTYRRGGWYGGGPWILGGGGGGWGGGGGGTFGGGGWGGGGGFSGGGGSFGGGGASGSW